MHQIVTVLLVVVAASAAQQQRIVGGAVTAINQYPEMAALLHSPTSSNHRQACAGVIINNRSILTSGYCVFGSANARWRTRVGSTNANSGGSVYNTNRITVHPQYNSFSRDNDIAIIRTSSSISTSMTVRVAFLAGANYNVLDNQIVWAAGWGATFAGGPGSEQLRHVQIWTVNLNTCRQNYAPIGRMVTDNMLCAGWQNNGGRDHCYGDEGAPLYHNGVVVGIRSWGQSCGLANFPGVSTRVSRYTTWISQNI